MKKSVLCLLVDGFEEIETVTPVDVLRRAGIKVTIAALTAKTATGKQGISLEADAMLDDLDASDFDLLLIPGGPGVAALRNDGRPAKLAAQFASKHKPVAAICAAPLVLLDAGLLEGKNFTAYHSVREELGGGLDDRVVVDDQIITSRGAGTALDFSLAIVKHLLDTKAATDIAEEIMA
jgi:4-methyl-5(b-hydroxyethyl)-thiazole monophosphate biosynthesis